MSKSVKEDSSAIIIFLSIIHHTTVLYLLLDGKYIFTHINEHHVFFLRPAHPADVIVIGSE